MIQLQVGDAVKWTTAGKVYIGEVYLIERHSENIQSVYLIFPDAKTRPSLAYDHSTTNPNRNINTSIPGYWVASESELLELVEKPYKRYKPYKSTLKIEEGKLKI